MNLLIVFIGILCLFILYFCIYCFFIWTAFPTEETIFNTDTQPTNEQNSAASTTDIPFLDSKKEPPPPYYNSSFKGCIGNTG